MKTTVVGYPRIGANRELKRAEEAYFKGEMDQAALRKVASDLRITNLATLKAHGLDLIPVGDFSYYDGVLDTAWLFGIVPARYRELGLDALDTYFAMAHGYQHAKGDVTALAMKKWFNTNYHYIVPEFEDGTEIALHPEELLSQVDEALGAGIKSSDLKISVLGPLSFLRLVLFTGKDTAETVSAKIAAAYVDLLAKFPAGCWVEFDEPWLVRDLSEEDVSLLFALYKAILAGKSGHKVLLQTYFGDIRDCYQTVMALPFDGVGLDFVEGKKTAELVRKYGVPEDKTLFAGIVNGKNIWRCNYEKALVDLPLTGSVVLTTSCSLLHVPYTTAAEKRLSRDILRHFAFAEEKLGELKELSLIAGARAEGADLSGVNAPSDKDAGTEKTDQAGANAPTAREVSAGEADQAGANVLKAGEAITGKRTQYRKARAALEANRALFAGTRVEPDPQVRAAIAALTPDSFERKPAFAEREKIQHEEFKLPLLPTTTIGSFPQTRDVRQNRTKLRKGEITREQYDAFNKEKIRECVELQEKLGFDVLVHGEYERNDMVEYFGNHLKGFLFTDNAWVQSYGTRCVKPPIIWGDVRRTEPITVSTSVYAQSLTKKPMKGMLTGPVTILNWSFPREDISRKDSTLQIALAIREEVLDLEKNGIRVIQIDEAALREKLPLRKSDWHSEYLDWAIPAFRLVHSGVKPTTQIHTHMCYSDYSDIIKDIDNMDADVITFEASRSNLSILGALQRAGFRTEVGPGVYDIHSARIPSEKEIEDKIREILQFVPKEKLWINPDCGLKTRGVEETIPSLTNLVAAAKAVRATLG